MVAISKSRPRNDFAAASRLPFRFPEKHRHSARAVEQIQEKRK
jgi:hypothetical protein